MHWRNAPLTNWENDMTDTYRVFKRRPWKKNPAWPNGWEPDGGASKTTVRKGCDLATARTICAEGNANIKRDKSGSIKPGQMFYEFERE